ncbi:MAG TPA: hypothetical protein VK186_14860 [Candidatus Deferrimicrobium sp.]|nr:hypothetical protein [Candidatus Deferrimicrobium sp.]
MNFPGLVFFYLEGIEKIDGLEDGSKIMIAVRSLIKYLQAKVDFSKRIQLKHFAGYRRVTRYGLPVTCYP